MVICPDCGKEVPNAKFCKNCGTLLPNENINIGEENLGNNNGNAEDAIFEDFIKEEKDYSDAFINDDVESENKPNGNFKLRSTISKVKFFLNWIDIRLET